MPDKKYVYLFQEGKKEMKSLLGGKGANLAEMTRIGLPVPPGITITTETCNDFFASGQKFPEGMEEQAWELFAKVEEAAGKKFGDREDPLLVSVRSGAAISMPGMMDTILNLGLNDETVKGLVAKTGDERFSMDCYRRFIQMFGNVVTGIEDIEFEGILEEEKSRAGVTYDYELDAAALGNIIMGYKKVYKNIIGSDFPQDPKEQMLMAVKAVFDSWNTPRAIVYRQLNKIPDELGTAVNIQVMAFGNMGDTSGTGVAFTRNPSTGENRLYGEYLINAQGEDVVAGIRTPSPISHLAEDMPDVYRQFTEVASLLEKHYRDTQDIEFTIQEGKLYLLQTRTGKRTAAAAVKIAVEMVEEGLIDKKEALLRVDPGQLDKLLHRSIDPEAELNIIANGLPASPGAAAGKIVFDADEAERRGSEGENLLLVRTETTPDDIHGIVKSTGILTSRGGMTSHAAVVARGMGKPCVSGCEMLKVDYEREQITVNGLVVKKDDIVTINGSTGDVILGEAPLVEPKLDDDFRTILGWAEEAKRLGVRANADTPEDAEAARSFGAKGIGLCRTEHMFMAQERLPYVQKMIMAEKLEDREEQLAKLLEFQEEDFYGILKAMAGFPVTIRLLDPPLHEFLPNREDLLVELTEMRCKGADEEEIREKEELLRKVNGLSEFNPMLGHRGCRLGITYPEIYRMQARAVFNAQVRLQAEGIETDPEVEIPLVIDLNEFTYLKGEIEKTATEVKAVSGKEFSYAIGTMIELPRACVRADEIAGEAEFFSFGTNDLTQTTLGFSRDDAEGKFMSDYLSKKIFADNPFAVLDRKGVGELMKLAVGKGRSVKPDLLIGICGEHGGEPSSVEFCHEIGLDFVSCSPYRVPIAILAAAQAAIK